MGRRRKGRSINGVLLLNKGLGVSSNHALQQVKRLFGAAKAGHTGALDPLATGMLPICLGEATKFSQFLLDADKTYLVTAKLGIRTTTSDADGEVIETATVNVSNAQLNQKLALFRGHQKQVPTMFSALKYQGKPLYHYARQGIEVPREPRDIHVYKLELMAFEGDEISLLVHCSKGTYIRTIVDDLGQALGCGAYVIKLHRSEVADYPAKQMQTIEELEALHESDDEDDFSQLDRHLLPMDTPVARLNSVIIDQNGQIKFIHGNPVLVEDTDYEGQQVRVYNTVDKLFLGVGLIREAQLHPKRLVVYET
jgi:tRNA pseudouridine55 synthase